MEETTDLLVHELETNGIKVPNEKIRRVYEATNGLPLAVKLIAARVKKTHPGALDYILQRLSTIDFGKPTEVYEQFYRFIYREIWRDLSKDAKSLLIKLSTFSVGEQITYENLQFAFSDNQEKLSSAQKDRFAQAFSEIIKFALLESKETSNEYRFFIHPLTKAFVRADLLRRNQAVSRGSSPEI